MQDSVKRFTDIEEPTNLYLFVPLSSWIAPRFARLGITANMVSFGGLACGLTAAVMYHFYAEGVLWSVGGFLLMCLWHVLDGADGQVARLTNSQSEFGKVIDGVCDYVTFIAVYISLAWVMMDEYGSEIWYIAVFAGCCHAIQAGAYELQRQEFDFWGLGKKSAELPDLKSLGEGASELPILGKIAFFLTNAYTRMQYRFSGLDKNLRRILYKYIEENPDKTEDLRESYRKHYTPIVHKWGIMCANYRTYAIFVACIIGQPVLFFIAEIFMLGFLHMVLVQKQQKCNDDFVQSLSPDISA